MSLLRDVELARVYARSRGPVAVVDESYRLGQRGQVGFYTLTSVLYERTSMESARRDLVAVAGPRPWHTTEQFEAGRDDRIHQLLEVVAGHCEWSILTVQAPVQGHSAQDRSAAREACFTVLLREVTRGSDPVQVVVADTLGDAKLDGTDRNLAARLRGRGVVPQSLLLRHADDKHEPLLWAPDVVGWAVRRLLARDEPGWTEAISDVTTVLDATSGKHLDLAQIRNSAMPAAARTAPDGVAGLTSAEAEGARPSLLPRPASQPDVEPGKRS